MKNSRMTICVMAVFVFVSVSPVMGWIQYNDGGTYDISTTINDDVWVDYLAPGMGTTVNMLSGGSIPSPYTLQEFNDSILTISGGSVGGDLYAYDSSSVSMSDGLVGGHLRAYDSTQVTISGGTLGLSSVYNNSQITVSGGTFSQITASDSSQITISGGISNHQINAFDSSQVTMSNGTVEGVQAYEGSQVTMSNGTVNDYFVARDSALVTMSGGTVGHLSAVGSSQVTMSNGTVVDYLYASDNGQLTMSGGTVSGDFRVQTTSTLIIVGSDFSIDGTPVDYGNITSIFGGSYNSDPYRTLTGTLLSGDVINNQFRIGDTAQITLVPELTTLLLLGLGGLVLRRRNIIFPSATCL